MEPLQPQRRTKKPRQKKRNNTHFTKKDKITLGLAAAGVIISSVILLYAVFFAPDSSGLRTTTPSTTPHSGEQFPYTNALDGTGSYDPAVEKPEVMAVMIDNHPEARPQQIGLAQARVVYEAPVEGGYTRFMALFARTDAVPRVGAVRSARPYFVDWASEYHALYWHSGGSPEALGILKDDAKSGVIDVNEFWNGAFFWRDTGLDAPHNLFTSSSRWQAYGEVQVQESTTPWQRWQFGTTTIAISSITAHRVTILYGNDYFVEWRYNTSTNAYERFLNGDAVKDATGQQLTATTILIQKTNVQTIDSEGRKKIATVGSGQATVVSRGLMLQGEWNKTAHQRTVFLTPAHNEMVFAPGNLWVEVVPLGTEVQIGN